MASAAYANNIGFILWHVARGEDRMITQLSGGSTDLWESEGLYERFGQPVEMPDPGDRMGLRSLAIPSIDTLISYLKAAHQKTSGYLATLSDDRLAEIPETYPRGASVGQALRHLITHKNNHHGQIRLHPRPARPKLGPATRHRHDPADRIVTRPITPWPIRAQLASAGSAARSASHHSAISKMSVVWVSASKG